MLPATAAALAVLAALLAWPVPALLARARWPRRDPLVALVCWQAIGLAGGLSIIGALLVHGLAPWGHSLPEAVWAVATGHPAEAPVRGDHWVTLTLAAVLAHERAHLREHHHLYLLPFVAWEAALPVLPAAGRAHAAVRTLVEMRADDVALGSLPGRAPRRTLAQAIVVAAGGAGGAGVPSGALAVTGSAVGARVVRLLEPPSPLPAWARVLALLSAGLLLLVPTALLLLPA